MFTSSRSGISRRDKLYRTRIRDKGGPRVAKPPYEKLIVACASSTEDTSTTRGGSGHSSEEASKK